MVGICLVDSVLPCRMMEEEEEAAIHSQIIKTESILMKIYFSTFHVKYIIFIGYHPDDDYMITYYEWKCLYNFIKYYVKKRCFEEGYE